MVTRVDLLQQSGIFKRALTSVVCEANQGIKFVLGQRYLHVVVHRLFCPVGVMRQQLRRLLLGDAVSCLNATGVAVPDGHDAGGVVVSLQLQAFVRFETVQSVGAE